MSQVVHILCEHAVPTVGMDTRHDELTLVSSKVGPDILDQTFTVVPTHVAHVVECDVVCHATEVTAGRVDADVVAVAGKVELKV